MEEAASQGGCLLNALKEALSLYGIPEIFNTDQGVQFTSQDFIGVLESNNIDISMDGKGRWIDNVFVERLWRSLKYEEIYLKAYENAKEARLGIATWFQFYKTQRRHQSLNRQTPDCVFLMQDSCTDAA